MVKVNKVSKKNRTSKKQYSRSTKKGGGTETIVEASSFLKRAIDIGILDSHKNLNHLTSFIKERILPQSNEEDIKRYLKYINNYLHTIWIEILRVYKQVDGIVFSVAFSPNSERIAAGLNRQLRIINVKNSIELEKKNDKPGFDSDSKNNELKIRTGYINSVAWSPDGKQIAIGEGAPYENPKPGYLKVLDVKTGDEQHNIEHDDAVSSVAWSPSGKKIATGSKNKYLRIFDVDTGSEEYSIEHTYPIKSVAWSPDGKHIATGSGVADTLKSSDFFEFIKEKKKPDYNGMLQVFNFKDESLVKNDNIEQEFKNESIESVVWSPDSKQIAIGSAVIINNLRYRDTNSGSRRVFHTNGYLRIFNANTGDKLHEIKYDGQVSSLVWRHDGQQIATSIYHSHDDFNNYVSIVNAKTGKELEKVQNTMMIMSVTWSKDGRQIATGSNSSISVFNKQDKDEDKDESNYNFDKQSDNISTNYSLITDEELTQLIKLVNYLAGRASLVEDMPGGVSPNEYFDNFYVKLGGMDSLYQYLLREKKERKEIRHGKLTKLKEGRARIKKAREREAEEKIRFGELKELNREKRIKIIEKGENILTKEEIKNAKYQYEVVHGAKCNEINERIEINDKNDKNNSKKELICKKSKSLLGRKIKSSLTKKKGTKSLGNFGKKLKYDWCHKGPCWHKLSTLNKISRKLKRQKNNN